MNLTLTFKLSKDDIIRQGYASPKDVVIRDLELGRNVVFLEFQDLLAVAQFEYALAEVKKELLK